MEAEKGSVVMRVLPERITKHSLHIIFFLLLVLITGSVGVGILVQKNILIEGFDRYFYTVLANHFHNPITDLLILPFNYNFLPDYFSPGRLPSYFYPMILGTLGYLWWKKRSLVGWAFFCFFFGTFLAIAVTFLDWHFVFRSRPFLTLPNPVDDFGRMAWSQLSSYPSGHARETALYSTIISNFVPRLKWPLIIFTAFVAYSRVYIGAHFPSDAIAGVLIGYLAAKTSLIIAREAQLAFKQRTGGNHATRPQSVHSH